MRISELQRKANIYDLFPDDYVITGGPALLIEQQAQRIAELESRTFTVQLPGERHDDDGSVTSDFDRGWNAYRYAIFDHPGNTTEKVESVISNNTFNQALVKQEALSTIFYAARFLLDALYEFGPDEMAISECVTNLEDALRDVVLEAEKASPPQEAPCTR